MKNIIPALVLALISSSVAFAGDQVDKKQLTIDRNSLVIQELPVPGKVTRGGPDGDDEMVDPQVMPPAGNNGHHGGHAVGTHHGQPGPSVPSVPTIPSIPTIPSVPTLPPPPVGGPNGQPTFGQQIGEASQVVGLIDQIVNLVDKIFTLIAKNQPVVDINVNYANAVPYGISHWTQLQGWKTPAVKRYQLTYKNPYGAKVVDIVYQLHYTYGGNYKGVGKFLTGVTVEPIKVSTAWGYNVDMTAEVPDSTIVNVGTSENPVAGMQVQLKYKIHTIVSDVQEKVMFYVQGDGLVKNLTPVRSATAQKNIEKVQKQIKNVKF